MDEFSGAELYKHKLRGRTRAEIAEFTGLTMGQVGGRIYRYEQTLAGKQADHSALFQFDIEKPMELDGDWMIIGDVHAPTTDYDFAQLVSVIAERDGIKQLLIAGDILNNDIFSTHPTEDVKVPWKREKAAARALLLEWIDQFDTIVLTAGNHERRLSKATWGEYSMEDLRDLLIGYNSKVKVSRYGYCVINTPTGPWRITHPKKYATIPLKTASAIAGRFRMHAWLFHEHYLGISWASHGPHIIVNGGGLHESKFMDYVILDDNTMPEMRKGFGTLIGGYPKLYGESPFTNWHHELAESQAARPALTIVQGDKAA